MIRPDPFAALRYLSIPSVEEIFRSALPPKDRDSAAVAAGQPGRVEFVASQDGDGVILVSLGCGGRGPTDAHVAAFWRKSGLSPTEDMGRLSGGKRLFRAKMDARQ